MKTIIYLDRSYLSNLTDARLEGNGHPFRQLYDLLLTGVHADEIVCPASLSQYNETQMDTRLVRGGYLTLEELYCGVEFLYFTDVINAQATSALYEHLGQTQPPQTSWKAAFKTNPHDHFDGVTRRIDLSGHELFIEQLRSVKERYEEEPTPDRAENWEAQKRLEANQIADSLYPMPPEALSIRTMGDLELVFAGLLERRPTREEKHKFQKSKELQSVPYIDIYAELRASMIWGSADRKPQGSDLEDVMAASLALPYCDLYTTDGLWGAKITSVSGDGSRSQPLVLVV